MTAFELVSNSQFAIRCGTSGSRQLAASPHAVPVWTFDVSFGCWLKRKYVRDASYCAFAMNANVSDLHTVCSTQPVPQLLKGPFIVIWFHCRRVLEVVTSCTRALLSGVRLYCSLFLSLIIYSGKWVFSKARQSIYNVELAVQRKFAHYDFICRMCTNNGAPTE